MNKQLIEKYKEKNIEDIKIYGKAHEFFKTSRSFYEDLQDGIADENSFFDNTITLYEEVDQPKRKPDYTSDSGSQYWYSKKGVIRGSNHWGIAVANCDWALKRKNGRTVYGYNHKCFTKFTYYLYGFSNWKDFIFKGKIINIDGDEVFTTFANHRGPGLVEHKGKIYQRVITETYEKVE